MRQTFKKEERLNAKKTIEAVFASGRSIASPPFRMLWAVQKQETAVPLQLGISVPKRSFAKAVVRNRLKRRIREAYRKNKENIYEVLKKKNLSVTVMMIYTAKEELAYTEIEKKMIVSLHKLAAALQ